MKELEYTLSSDLLFKMLFVKYPELLKNLISVVLEISTDDMDDFVIFSCDEYHSEYLPLEKSNHSLLTDKMSLHYFELPKIKGEIDKTNILELWLRLFNAKTEEDINKILNLEVPIMKEAINAYRKVSTSDEYKELERLTSKTKHNEASALYHAEQIGRAKERAAWESKITIMEKKIAEKDAEIARLSNKNPE